MHLLRMRRIRVTVRKTRDKGTYITYERHYSTLRQLFIPETVRERDKAKEKDCETRNRQRDSVLPSGDWVTQADVASFYTLFP